MAKLDEALAAYPQIKGVHPACAAVPDMDVEDYAELLASVGKHGLFKQEPIDLTPDGMLLDGRNRLMACFENEKAPHFRTIKLDPWEYVKAKNIARRQLKVGQRAMFGQAMLAAEREAAKERQLRKPADSVVEPVPPQNTGKARDKAGASVGVSGKSIDMADFIATTAPDIADEVKAGKIDLKPAYREAKKREKERESQPSDKPFKLDPKAGETAEIVTVDGRAKTIKTPKNVSFNRTNDSVDWASWTWNPVTGCDHGCKFCYAREIAHSERMADYYPFQFAPTFHEYRLTAPKHTSRPNSEDERDGRVFVCSMADLFGKWVPDKWIRSVFDACLASPEWEYLFLTKWPARYAKMPLLPKAWYGASVVRQSDVTRVEKAMQDFDAGEGIKWVSMEPMLEPIRFNFIDWCDLMVIGSQTQTYQPDGLVEAFAPEFDWIVDMVNQCRDAGVPYYIKQNCGTKAPGMHLPNMQPRKKG
jgi:protein gp37